MKRKNPSLLSFYIIAMFEKLFKKITKKKYVIFLSPRELIMYLSQVEKIAFDQYYQIYYLSRNFS